MNICTCNRLHENCYRKSFDFDVHKNYILFLIVFSEWFFFFFVLFYLNPNACEIFLFQLCSCLFLTINVIARFIVYGFNLFYYNYCSPGYNINYILVNNSIHLLYTIWYSDILYCIK